MTNVLRWIKTKTGVDFYFQTVVFHRHWDPAELDVWFGPPNQGD
jgi:hypothetical protein